VVLAADRPEPSEHNLRHRYASRSCPGTRIPRDIQELLRHLEPGTTMRYTVGRCCGGLCAPSGIGDDFRDADQETALGVGLAPRSAGGAA